MSDLPGHSNPADKATGNLATLTLVGTVLAASIQALLDQPYDPVTRAGARLALNAATHVGLRSGR